jgi:hypothetical protein
MDTKKIIAIVIALASAGYFLPLAIALWRSHPKTTNIFLLNLLLGWTVIGWVIALVWSLK